MISEIKKIIDDNDNFIILPHKSPDGDTIGSSIALLNVLNNLDKEAYIILDDEIPFNLRFLNINRMTTEEFDSKKFEYDIVFTIDSSDISRFENRKKYLENKFVINIDHHITNTKYGDINLIREASSVGEILYDIFDKLNLDINKIIAESLYVSITTDTGSFKYSNTSSNTLSIASKLRELIDLEKINVELFQNIKYDSFLLKNIVMSTLKIYNDIFGVIYLTNKMREKLELLDYDTDGLVEEVRNISGIEISAFIKEIGIEFYKVSLRSKYDFDVAEVALKYNGGGHKKAAGFAVDGNLNEIIDNLVNLVNRWYNGDTTWN